MNTAALLLAALLQSPADVPGTRYTFRMVTKDDSTVGVVREDGRRARIDLVHDRDRDDDYLLVLDGGREVVSVHPREGEYAATDAERFTRLAGIGLHAASSTGIVRFRVRDLRVSSRRLGAGEPIAGWPTERFRLIQEFTVSVRAFGVVGETMRQVIVTDYWVSQSVTLVPNPLVELLSTVASVLGQSDREFVRRSSEERRALFSGTPLRIVVTAHSLDEPDDVSVQTIEIGDLERTRFDASVWDIPAGLRRREGEFSWRF